MCHDQSRLIDRIEEATWRRVGRPMAHAISAVDIHLNQMDTHGLNRGSLDRFNLDCWLQEL